MAQHVAKDQFALDALGASKDADGFGFSVGLFEEAVGEWRTSGHAKCVRGEAANGGGAVAFRDACFSAEAEPGVAA